MLYNYSEPPNKGQFGSRAFVLFSEVVLVVGGSFTSRIIFMYMHGLMTLILKQKSLVLNASRLLSKSMKWLETRLSTLARDDLLS